MKCVDYSCLQLPQLLYPLLMMNSYFRIGFSNKVGNDFPSSSVC